MECKKSISLLLININVKYKQKKARVWILLSTVPYMYFNFAFADHTLTTKLINKNVWFWNGGTKSIFLGRCCCCCFQGINFYINILLRNLLFCSNAHFYYVIWFLCNMRFHYLCCFSVHIKYCWLNAHRHPFGSNIRI